MIVLCNWCIVLQCFVELVSCVYSLSYKDCPNLSYCFILAIGSESIIHYRICCFSVCKCFGIMFILDKILFLMVE